MGYYVYIHTCKANGKRYVGCTTQASPERRWLEGRGYQYNKYFYRAIEKYGWDSFQHEAWELTCESEMYYAEKYLIAYYHTTESKFGYNHSTGGEKSALGGTRSEEARKRIAEAAKKSHRDPEFRKRQSEAIKKKWTDPEYRKKLSEIRKGTPHKPHSEETKRKIAGALKGKVVSEETKSRMSEAHKGKSQPRILIKLPDGTIVEITKNNLARDYINKGKKFEYVS